MINPYFSTLSYAPEQSLLEDLVTEAIGIFGFDTYYVVKQFSDTQDRLYTEDPQASFANAVPLTLYLKSAEAFEGDGHFLSSFGVEIRDQVTVICSRRTFAQDVDETQNLAVNGVAVHRPREGDLIYIPMNGRLFEIKFVQKYSMLYPLGTLPTWEMRLEVYEASGAHMDTGIPEIDIFETRTSLDVIRWAVETEANNSILLDYSGDFWVADSWNAAANEPLDQSPEIQKEANTYVDFSELDPFGDLPGGI